MPHRLALLKHAIEEICRGRVSADPTLVHEKAMDLIREDDLLKGYVVSPEPLRQVDRLLEGNVAVIVALDEQYRRFLGRNRRVGR